MYLLYAPGPVYVYFEAVNLGVFLTFWTSVEEKTDKERKRGNSD